MQTRTIGSLHVSVVGLGCNNFGGRIDERQTRQVVTAALDAGITFFDTADVYGGTHSEELLGKALGSRRSEVVVATKFGVPLDDEHPGGGHPDYVRRAVDDSLRRLGTDHIDLYQLHFPDPKTPLSDTLGAMGELVEAGKVREIGCSNFSVALIEEAQAAAKSLGRQFASVQNEYSILRREPEAGVLAAAQEAHMAFVPYFPLASGVLTGKYHRGQPPPEGTRLAGNPERASQLLTEETMEVVDQLSDLAVVHEHSLLELAIAWLLARPAVASVIAGATRADQVRANVAAAGWQLDDDVVAAVDQVAPPPS